MDCSDLRHSAITDATEENNSVRCIFIDVNKHQS